MNSYSRQQMDLFGSRNIFSLDVFPFANVVSMWMVLASLVYLMVLWPSWLGGLVDGAGDASFVWLRGVWEPVRRDSLSRRIEQEGRGSAAS